MTATPETPFDKGATVPLATFQELVAQYHHRLLSLEADLKDQARSGMMEPRAFASRVKKLKAIHKELAELRRLCLAESPASLGSADIGLPLLDDVTPAERAVCDRFLLEKEIELRILEDQTTQVYRWLVDAVTGYANPLRVILRLSRLRRMIQTFAKRMETLNEAASVMTLHIDKLLDKIQGTRARQIGRSTLEGLMTVFQHLDGQVARVARLRALVKKEEARTQAMAHWLKGQEDELAAKQETYMPPTPLATARAVAAEMGPTIGRRNARVKRRRGLAEQYWQDVLQNNAHPAPDDKAFKIAKRLLDKETE